MLPLSILTLVAISLAASAALTKRATGLCYHRKLVKKVLETQHMIAV